MPIPNLPAIGSRRPAWNEGRIAGQKRVAGPIGMDAGEVGAHVVFRLRCGRAPARLGGEPRRQTLDEGRGNEPGKGSAAEQRQLRDRLVREARMAGKLPAPKLRALLQAIKTRLPIEAERMRLEVSAAALAGHLHTTDASSADQPLQHVQPLILRKRGVETRLVLGGTEGGAPDPALVGLLVEARSCLRRICDGEVHSLRALARRLGREHRHVARILPLAFLAPDIVEAIIEGRQPGRANPDPAQAA